MRHDQGLDAFLKAQEQSWTSPSASDQSIGWMSMPTGGAPLRKNVMFTKAELAAWFFAGTTFGCVMIWFGYGLP